MRKNIFIFEADRAQADALLAALEPLGDEVCALVIAHHDQIEPLLEQAEVDLLVVDVDAPLLDGFALAARALRRRPTLPLLVITHGGAPDISRDLGRGRLRTLCKPVDCALLRHAVLALLPGATHGHLTGVTAAGLLQLLALERRSGVVVLDVPAGLVRLMMLRGELVHAEAAGARGEEAVFRVGRWLSRPEPHILVEDLSAVPERTIHRSLDAVLLEATRRADELLRAEATMPLTTEQCTP